MVLAEIRQREEHGHDVRGEIDGTPPVLAEDPREGLRKGGMFGERVQVLRSPRQRRDVKRRVNLHRHVFIVQPLEVIVHVLECGLYMRKMNRHARVGVERAFLLRLGEHAFLLANAQSLHLLGDDVDAARGELAEPIPGGGR